MAARLQDADAGIRKLAVRALAGAVRVMNPVYPQLESAWFQPSNWFLKPFAFLKCNLCRRYALGRLGERASAHVGTVAARLQDADASVRGGGRCTLTPPDPQLKGAWYPGGFNPCTYCVRNRFQSLPFTVNLHRYSEARGDERVDRDGNARVAARGGNRGGSRGPGRVREDGGQPRAPNAGPALAALGLR
jgi:hypothetical protein